MTVKIIESGAEVSFSESYACRLIEQGKAVPAPEKKKKTQKKAEVTESVSEEQDPC